MAVYTQISDDALEVFLKNYNIGELVSFKGIAEGVENSNYLLRTDRANFILTLYEKRVDANDLPFFLDLMRHLEARGLSCPTPCVKNNGQFMGMLSGRPAAIFTFLDGFSVSKPKPPHCRELGSALAAFHLAGEGFHQTRKNTLSVAGWRFLFDLTKSRANNLQPGLAQDIEQMLTILEASWPSDLKTGIIHADLFPDNVFFLKNRLSGIIDFYFACRDMFAYDIAICLNAWCFEPDLSFNITKARALLRGYEKVRSLDNDEKQALPLLACGAALRFLLTRLHDWLDVPHEALVIPHDPLEYWKKMLFHKTVKTAAEYGL